MCSIHATPMDKSVKTKGRGGVHPLRSLPTRLSCHAKPATTKPVRLHGMQRYLLVAALVLVAGPLCASGVYYSSCSVGPVDGSLTTQSGPGYCFVAAHIFNNGDFQLTGMAYDDTRSSPYGAVVALAQLYNDAGATDPPQQFEIISRAYETFETAGPLRPGIIQVSLLEGNTRFGISETGISDGVHTYAQGTCSEVLNPIGNFCSKSYTAPFELGKPFSALSYIDEAGNTNNELFFSPAGEGGSVNFSLFEADGVTPVDFVLAPDSTPGVPVNLAPEPDSFGMLATVIALGVSWRARRTSCFR